MSDIESYMQQLGAQAREASHEIARATTAQKNAALKSIARLIDESRDQLMAANKLDLENEIGRAHV